MENENVKKIKLHEVLTCGLEDSVDQIAKKMKDKKERRIFVIDEKKNLKGIITSTDFVYKCVAENSLKLKAKDIMTKDVKSVEMSEGLGKALEVMNELKTYSCPVTENGKIRGIISYHDLVGHLIADIEKC